MMTRKSTTIDVPPIRENLTLSPADSVRNQRRGRGSADTPKDVLDYIQDGYRDYALQQISHYKSIVYFLPLLRELFSGNMAKTEIVFTMLHSLMTDNRVFWSRHELDETFHWLKEKHRNYIIHRLSSVGWLEYHRDQNMYMISDKGEALMRILSRFTMGPELVENEGAALAEIEFSILLESKDLPDRLRFLSNRLHKHIIRAENALHSDSPFIILEIYQQLKSAYRWAEQTRKTIDQLDVDDNDVATWNGIRDIHNYLSRLHDLISKMQLRLQEIQHKQIDIARYGLSQLDFDYYLINSKVDDLSTMICRHLTGVPRPLLINDPIFLQEATDILGRERKTVRYTRSWDTDVSEADIHPDDDTATETEAFREQLNTIDRDWEGIDELISQVDWENAAYRFSLLTLLADRSDGNYGGDDDDDDRFDPLMGLPVEVEFDTDAELNETRYMDEIRRMTSGRVRNLDQETE